MDELLSLDAFQKSASQLAGVVRFLAAQGWTPATSSNFSTRIPGVDGKVAISKSGRDKYAFSADDVMVVDMQGQAIAPEGARPSAETLLHTLLYEDAGIGSVLHTHSLAATVLTMSNSSPELVVEGFELLKGLAGVKTHEHREVVPVFDNDQDMLRLSKLVRAHWQEHPEMHGFLIRGHGLYTWGANLAEARRHIETFEFLFACILRMKEL